MQRHVLFASESGGMTFVFCCANACCLACILTIAALDNLRVWLFVLYTICAGRGPDPVDILKWSWTALSGRGVGAPQDMAKITI